MLEYVNVMRLPIDVGMVVLIWLVQLVIYPSFRELGTDGFIAWHHSYMNRISLVVIPLMLAQAAAVLTMLFLQPSVGTIFSTGCVFMAWITTYAFSVPCHNTVQKKGKDMEAIERLITTNWIRTVAWSLAPLGLAF